MWLAPPSKWPDACTAPPQGGTDSWEHTLLKATCPPTELLFAGARPGDSREAQHVCTDTGLECERMGARA